MPKYCFLPSLSGNGRIVYGLAPQMVNTCSVAGQEFTKKEQAKLISIMEGL